MIERADEQEETSHIIKEPSLLRTCKVIRADATQIYYGRNSFAVSGGSGTGEKFNRWLQGLGSPKQAMLTSICCTIMGDTAHAEEEAFLPFYLLVIRSTKSRLERVDVAVKNDVVGVLYERNGVKYVLTEAEIMLRMKTEHWEIYAQLKADMMEQMSDLELHELEIT